MQMTGADEIIISRRSIFMSLLLLSESGTSTENINIIIVTRFIIDSTVLISINHVIWQLSQA